MTFAQNRVRADRLKILRHLLPTEAPNLFNLTQPSIIYALVKKLVEVKVILDQKGDGPRLEHHALILDLGLGPDVKTKGSILVFLCFIVPVEGADAYLKGDVLVDHRPEFLVAILVSVVLMTLVFWACRVTTKLKIYRNVICLFYALENQR